MGAKHRQLERDAILPQGRQAQVSLQMDWDAFQMLLEMSSPKTRGAFVCGLVRQEFAKQVERLERLKAGKPAIDERLVVVEH